MKTYKYARDNSFVGVTLVIDQEKCTCSMDDGIHEWNCATLKHNRKCSYCHGRKKVYTWYKWTKCPQCKGTGVA